MKQFRITTVFDLRMHVRGRLLFLFALIAVCMTAGQSQQASAQSLQYAPVITTIAGTGTAGYSGDGGAATSALLNAPQGAEVDSLGNVYFAESTSNYVRRIDAVTGIITTVAGGGSATCAGYTDAYGDGCLATAAILKNPRAVHFDPAGNLIIADTGNNLIRKIDKTTGIITRFLGTGVSGKTPPTNTSPVTPLTLAIQTPYFFTFDPAGNMIVAGNSGNFIAIAMAINGVVDPVNSPVYNLAGTGTATATAGSAANGDGGTAIVATFSQPRGLALDNLQNLYISDYGNSRIRKVTSPLVNGVVTVAGLNAATISTIAGSITAGDSGNGGLASAANVNAPVGAGFDFAGTFYFTQYGAGHEYIRSIDPFTGIINNYAGTGAAVTSTLSQGDGHAALVATFDSPFSIKFQNNNTFFVADSANQRVRRGSVTPVFFSQTIGTTSASQNVAILANAAATPATAAVSNTEFTLGTPSGCTLGTAMSAGSYCYFPMTFTPAGPGKRTAQLQIVDGSGTIYNDPVVGIGVAAAAAFGGAPISTVAGTGTAGFNGDGAAASAAQVSAPCGLVIDSKGNGFFVDGGNNVVRTVSKSTGFISTVAGTGAAGYTGDGGLATAATLNAPTDLTIDPAGNLYIVDTGNNVIREVVASTGNIITIAGTGTAGYSGDAGLATAAKLQAPQGIAIDMGGTLYVADTGNNALRAFVPGGVIVTLTGTGTAGFTGDGGMAHGAQLSAPTAVALDLSGNIYISDTGNGVVRKIKPITPGIVSFQATISTYAGTQGGTSNTGDGGLATAATLSSPAGLGTDAAGNLYIASGGQVRAVSASTGFIGTLAGKSATGSYSGENGPATAAVFSSVNNLYVDPAGSVYLSDATDNRILTISAGSAVMPFGTQLAGSTSSSKSVTLYNSGNSSLALSAITLADVTNFTLGTGTCTSSTTLAAGDSCTITATFSPTAAVRGNYSTTITVTDNALGSASSTQTIALNGTGNLTPVATMTAVSVASTAVYGNAVSVTATVTGANSPTGTVNFAVNGSTVGSATLNGSYQATYSISGLTAGANTITATYDGDDSNNSSSSSQATVTVSKAVLTVTPDNVGSYQYLPLATLTYGISGFVYGDTAASILSGAPALSTTATASSAVGPYPITATIGTLATSNSNYSFAFAQGTYTISLSSGLSTTTTVSAPATTYGNAATVNIAVSGGSSPTGTVSLSVNGTATATATLSNAAASVSLSNLQAGSYAISVVYSGDSTNAPSSGSATLVVNKATLTYTAANQSTVAGQALATLTYTPTGFVNGDTAAVVTGTPSITTTATTSSAVGTYPITVAAGTLAASNYGFSFVAGTYTVTAIPTTTVVIPSVTSTSYGTSVTATATVSRSVGATTGATGNVAFQVNGTTVATVAVNNSGVAMYTTTALALGTNTLTAVYAGDSYDAGSTSANASVTVSKAALTVTADNQSTVAGASLATLTYTITGFVNGDTAATAVTGTATTSTTASLTSIPGTYPITVTAGTLAATNYTFSYVAGTYTVTASPSATFTMTATPTAVTVSSGSTGSLSFTLTPSAGYSGTVNFAVSTLPAGVGVYMSTMSTQVSMPNGPTTVTATVVYNKATAQVESAGKALLAIGFPFLALGFCFGKKNRRNRIFTSLVLALGLLGALSGLSACGASTTNTASTVTITATDSVTGLKQTATINLTISK